jgi:hypothetical protein
MTADRGAVARPDILCAANGGNVAMSDGTGGADGEAGRWLDLLRDGTPEQRALARTELGLIFERRGMVREAAEAYWATVKAAKITPQIPIEEGLGAMRKAADAGYRPPLAVDRTSRDHARVAASGMRAALFIVGDRTAGAAGRYESTGPSERLGRRRDLRLFSALV